MRNLVMKTVLKSQDIQKVGQKTGNKTRPSNQQPKEWCEDGIRRVKAIATLKSQEDAKGETRQVSIAINVTNMEHHIGLKEF